MLTLAKFGAVITDLDLNNVDDNTIAQLRDEIWKNKMVVVKNQRALEPRKQWELMKRLDPAAPAISRQETAYSFYPPETTGNNLFVRASPLLVCSILTIRTGHSELHLGVGRRRGAHHRQGLPGRRPLRQEEL